MPQNHISLSEQTVGTGQSREWMVRASADDQREWLRHAPVCAALQRRDISHVGVAEARHPYAVVRPRLNGMFVMVCVAGAGEVLLEGRWRTFRAGYACLVPPHAPNAYRCVPGRNWVFAWVRYVQASTRRSVVLNTTALLAPFRGEALKSAVMGLYHETRGANQPAVLDQWVGLIESYVRDFTRPWREDDRLREVWQAVAADLAAPWTVTELAARARLSDEQLRRLCLATLGRSPRQQLTWMRIERAAAQLARGGQKIEAVARSVGYASVFSFSNTFQRLLGCRPSKYRTSQSATQAPRLNS